MVRQRNRLGQGPGKAKRSLCRKDSSGSMSEIPTGKEEGLYLTNIYCSNLLTISLTMHCSQECLKFFMWLFFLPLFVVGWTEALPDTPVDEAPPGPEVPEKIKKRYRKKKTKLEEAFPTYLQVCLFCSESLSIRFEQNLIEIFIWIVALRQLSILWSVF